MNWKGVMPAITTCFNADLGVDHAFMARHCTWLVENGCTGVVALGSLGEGATLSFDEKREILQNCVKALGGKVPIVSAISSLSTLESIALARMALDAGCKGLMVLPPYVYKGNWREMKAHVTAVFKATALPCMLYNNPVAYGTDFLPEHVQELASAHENLVAVKESSTDVRRVSAIRALLGTRLAVFIGVDDAVLEAVGAGASGWIAGLANAFPRESVALFNSVKNGESGKAFELYRWFLPLLRMDTVPNFVQLIKLAQTETGIGNARVRTPRLELDGDELQRAKQTIHQALQSRPKSVSSSAFTGGK